jgi:hypothetical protein
VVRQQKSYGVQLQQQLAAHVPRGKVLRSTQQWNQDLSAKSTLMPVETKEAGYSAVTQAKKLQPFYKTATMLLYAFRLLSTAVCPVSPDLE